MKEHVIIVPVTRFLLVTQRKTKLKRFLRDLEVFRNTLLTQIKYTYKFLDEGKCKNKNLCKALLGGYFHLYLASVVLEREFSKFNIAENVYGFMNIYFRYSNAANNFLNNLIGESASGKQAALYYAMLAVVEDFIDYFSMFRTLIALDNFNIELYKLFREIISFNQSDVIRKYYDPKKKDKKNFNKAFEKLVETILSGIGDSHSEDIRIKEIGNMLLYSLTFNERILLSSERYDQIRPLYAVFIPYTDAISKEIKLINIINEIASNAYTAFMLLPRPETTNVAISTIKSRKENGEEFSFWFIQPRDIYVPLRSLFYVGLSSNNIKEYSICAPNYPGSLVSVIGKIFFVNSKNENKSANEKTGTEKPKYIFDIYNFRYTVCPYNINRYVLSFNSKYIYKVKECTDKTNTESKNEKANTYNNIERIHILEKRSRPHEFSLHEKSGELHCPYKYERCDIFYAKKVLDSYIRSEQIELIKSHKDGELNKLAFSGLYKVCMYDSRFLPEVLNMLVKGEDYNAEYKKDKKLMFGVSFPCVQRLNKHNVYKVQENKGNNEVTEGIYRLLLYSIKTDEDENEKVVREFIKDVMPHISDERIIKKIAKRYVKESRVLPKVSKVLVSFNIREIIDNKENKERDNDIKKIEKVLERRIIDLMSPVIPKQDKKHVLEREFLKYFEFEDNKNSYKVDFTIFKIEFKIETEEEGNIKGTVREISKIKLYTYGFLITENNKEGNTRKYYFLSGCFRPFILCDFMRYKYKAIDIGGLLSRIMEERGDVDYKECLDHIPVENVVNYAIYYYKGNFFKKLLRQNVGNEPHQSSTNVVYWHKKPKMKNVDELLVKRLFDDKCYENYISLLLRREDLPYIPSKSRRELTKLNPMKSYERRRYKYLVES